MTLFPPIRMSPPSGSSNPASIRSAVVFPQPDGPSSTSSSRSGIASESPRTAAAVCDAKRFQTSSNSTSATLQAPRAVHQATDHQSSRAEEDDHHGQEI